MGKELLKMARIPNERDQDDFVGAIGGEIDGIPEVAGSISSPAVSIKIKRETIGGKAQIVVALKKGPSTKSCVRAFEIKGKIAVDGFHREAIFPKLDISVEFAVGDDTSFSRLL